MVLTIEYIYTDLVRAGRVLRPGSTFDGVATVGDRRIPVRVEVNRVWGSGRLLFTCAPLREALHTALRAVLSQCASACRRCWGLTYSTQTTRNYEDSGPIWFGVRVTHRGVRDFKPRGCGSSWSTRRVSGRPSAGSFATASAVTRHGREHSTSSIRALVDRGDEVVYVSTDAFAGRIREVGAPFRPYRNRFLADLRQPPIAPTRSHGC